MRPLALLLPCLILIPAGAAAQEACGEARTAIGWTQPPRIPIDDPEAVRWPVDATIRIGYGGTPCPVETQFELIAEDGTEVPAQVRVRTPFLAAGHDELPVTVIEIDPVPVLEPRTAYTLRWRPTDPKLASHADFALEFKTLARTMDPLPVDAFEGVLAVSADGPCSEDQGTPVVRPAGSRRYPECDAVARVVPTVRFTPVNRRDIIYAVERVSSTPAEGAAETDATLVALIGGGEDVWISERADVFVPVALPLAPLPRVDCFQVRMLDAQGRPAGGEGQACINLPEDLPCGVEPVQPGVIPDPIPGLACLNLGLYGADPDTVPPAEGPPSDDPAADDADSAASSGCCRIAPGRERAPYGLFGLALLSLALRSRRQRG